MWFLLNHLTLFFQLLCSNDHCFIQNRCLLIIELDLFYLDVFEVRCSSVRKINSVAPKNIHFLLFIIFKHRYCISYQFNKSTWYMHMCCRSHFADFPLFAFCDLGQMPVFHLFFSNQQLKKFCGKIKMPMMCIIFFKPKQKLKY